MMAWGAPVPSSPALRAPLLRVRGLTARPAHAGGGFHVQCRPLRRFGQDSIRHCPQGHVLTFTPLHMLNGEAVAPSTCYELRRATHCPEHPRSGNCQTPLPCPSESCPSALAHTPSAPMLTSTRPRSPTRPSAVKKPRSPAWLISPFRMNSSISRSTQDPWLTLSDTDQSPS